MALGCQKIENADELFTFMVTFSCSMFRKTRDASQIAQDKEVPQNMPAEEADEKVPQNVPYEGGQPKLPLLCLTYAHRVRLPLGTNAIAAEDGSSSEESNSERARSEKLSYDESTENVQSDINHHSAQDPKDW